MKTKIDKRVNKIIKKLNKQIREDVFGNRFYAHQLQKARLNGVSYYLYEFIDNENKDATLVQWFNEFEIVQFYKPWRIMNDLIVESDF